MIKLRTLQIHLNIYSHFIFIIAILCSVNISAQQACTQKKGEGYFQIGVSTLSYDALHGEDYAAMDIPRPISEVILSYYGEFGISNNLMLTFIAPLHIVSSGALADGWTSFAPEKGNLTSLGNVRFGLTYKIFQNNKFTLSSKLNIGLNTAKLEETSGLRTGFDATTVSPSILAGIGTSNYFASFQSGFDLLTNGYQNRFIFNAQYGKSIFNNTKIIFIIGLLTSTSMGNSTDLNNIFLDGNSSFTGLYLNEQSYYALNLKLGYHLNNNWTIWSSVGGGIAKNVGRNAVYYLSIAYNLKKETIEEY